MKIDKEFGMFSEEGNRKIQRLAQEFADNTENEGTVANIEKHAKKFLTSFVKMSREALYMEANDTDVRDTVWWVLKKVIREHITDRFVRIDEFANHLWVEYYEKLWWE